MNEQQIEQALVKIHKVKKWWFVIFNLTYVLAYLAYAIFSFYNEQTGVYWLPYVLIAFSIAYFISFIFILCLRNEQKVKLFVKNYKIILKFFKRALRLFNLVLSIIMITSSVMYDTNTFAFVLTITNLVIISLQMIMSITKFIRTNYHREKKAYKKQLKKDLVHDILTIALAFDDDVFEDNAEENNSLDQSENNYPITKEDGNISLRKLAIVRFANTNHPVKRLKDVVTNSIVNSLVNADKIVDRVQQYKEDKSRMIKK